MDATGKKVLLYSFTGKADGASPFGDLIRDVAGNLYGVTRYGGDFSCGGGCGTVFKVDVSGKETVLYSFTGAPDGAVPQAALIRDAAGTFYGTTQNGGASGHGAIFRFNIAGSAPQITSQPINQTVFLGTSVTLSVAVTGGFPLSACVGRAEVMDWVAKGAAQQGTFNGNPLSARAGLVALTEVLTSDAYEHLGKLGALLAEGCRRAIQEYRIPAHAVDLGAKGCVSYRREPLRNYRDYLDCNPDLFAASWP